MASRFGDWETAYGLPAFAYLADHEVHPDAEWDTLEYGPTRLHWAGFGNRRLQVFAYNDGTVAVWDEADGMRWLTAPQPGGTGVFRATEPGAAATWSTAYAERPPGSTVKRLFGPTWFQVALAHDGLAIERTVLCPEGEVPWLLIRVRLTAARPMTIRHLEEWTIRPLYPNMFVARTISAAVATECIDYLVEEHPRRVEATELRSGESTRVFPQADYAPLVVPLAIGPPARLRLEALGEHEVNAHTDGARHPALRLSGETYLEPDRPHERWFRFGRVDDSSVVDPAGLWEESLAAVRKRLPAAACDRAPVAAREIPWHAALLTGAACADQVLGGHTLNQGAPYSYQLGFNGAARDPLQHAVPLIYSEPDLALSVLRNSAAWAAPDGWLPYLIDAEKGIRAGGQLGPMARLEVASDSALWALWLASEYVIATGDAAALAEPVGFHPSYRTPPVPLYENLRRQYRQFVDRVGLGPNGHVRVRDCDWSDGHLGELAAAGIDRAQFRERGESVMNSALAAWVLPLWAGVCERVGDAESATEARALAAGLRVAVAGAWNGRWFRRALCGEVAIGDETLFAEVQPWALLCGAADAGRARELLRRLDKRLRQGAPLGARQKWPLPAAATRSGIPGESVNGGHWFAIQGPLIWAAARYDPELAWDEWRRMSLAGHTEAYPGVWEGTISGPEGYNAPESPRPGRARYVSWVSVQAFPVNNSHCHAQPLLAYLRLLGVEPQPDGALRVGGGGGFESQAFQLHADGSGQLRSRGPVEIAAGHGRVQGGPGLVAW